MSAIDLRERYSDMLLDSVREANYPSIAMLSRVEASIADSETMERYIELLMEKVGNDRFPSPTMLDRINGLLSSLAALEQQAEAGAA